METTVRRKSLVSLALLLAISALGFAALLFFWDALLKPDDFTAFSLPLVAFIAGPAATFNPCALPTLPAFLTRMSGEKACDGYLSHPSEIRAKTRLFDTKKLKNGAEIRADTLSSHHSEGRGRRVICSCQRWDYRIGRGLSQGCCRD